MSYLHDAPKAEPLPPHTLNVIAETDTLASLWTILREMQPEAQIPALRWLESKVITVREIGVIEDESETLHEGE